MTTKHPPIEFIAGDDWEIRATLLDELGVPYDLSQPHTIKWRLLNEKQVAMIGDDAIITITDGVAGKCSVKVPSAVSTVLVGGFYMDALRLTMAGETGTLWFGVVNVVSDPWANAEGAMFARTTEEKRNFQLVRTGGVARGIVNG